MLATPGVVTPLRPLLPRALVTYLLLRGLVIVAILLMGSLGGRGGLLLGDPLGILPANPPAFAVLLAIVGAVDTKRRRERMLWANLGYSTGHIAGIFAVTAAIGELLLGILLPR